MAQILKQELKDKILFSARRELLKYGYRDASMRRIALEASMTVGNLYNYFSSKDELIACITHDSIEALDRLISEFTDQQLSFKKGSMDVSQLKIQSILNDFSLALVRLFVEKKEEMLILMLNSSVNEKLSDWFASMLSCVIDDEDNEYNRLMSESVAISIFDGLKNIFITFKDQQLTGENLNLLEKLVRDYMSVFNFIFSKYYYGG